MLSVATPTIEAYETPVIGSRVWWYERDAMGGRKRARRKVRGILAAIDGHMASMRAADNLQWIVPLRKVHRFRGEISKAYGKATRRAHYASTYKGLSATKRKRLLSCARDAREVSMSLCAPDYTGPVTPQYLAEMKRCREATMRKAGMGTCGDTCDCRAMPMLLARTLRAGQEPSLRGVDYLSVESGAIGPRQIVTLGGRRWCVTGFSGDMVTLRSGRDTLEVPMERIPRDKGTRVGKCRVQRHVKRYVKRRAYRKLTVSGKRHCMKLCVCRSRRGRFAACRHAGRRR